MNANLYLPGCGGRHHRRRRELLRLFYLSAHHRSVINLDFISGSTDSTPALVQLRQITSDSIPQNQLVLFRSFRCCNASGCFVIHNLTLATCGLQSIINQDASLGQIVLLLPRCIVNEADTDQVVTSSQHCKLCVCFALIGSSVSLERLCFFDLQTLAIGYVNTTSIITIAAGLRTLKSGYQQVNCYL